MKKKKQKAKSVNIQPQILIISPHTQQLRPPVDVWLYKYAAISKNAFLL